MPDVHRRRQAGAPLSLLQPYLDRSGNAPKDIPDTTPQSTRQVNADSLGSKLETLAGGEPDIEDPDDDADGPSNLGARLVAIAKSECKDPERSNINFMKLLSALLTAKSR